MAKFCTQCGAQVDETAKFCKKCGARLAPTQSAHTQSAPAQSAPAQSAPAQSGGYSAPTITNHPPNHQNPPGFGADQPPYQQPYQGAYQQPYQAPYQAPAPQADLKPNIAGMLCYPLSFITGILFLVLAPYNKDRFVRFHAWQSIFFFLTMLVLSIGVRILPWFLEGMFLLVLELSALGGTGWLMYKAYNNERFKLPLIGDWAENQASKEP
jgi:uncharacterized membrane protein